MLDEPRKGQVKFYSNEKGYGFIASEQSEDTFFHITAVNGAEPPKTGDVVMFKRASNGGKVRAVDIDILVSKEIIRSESTANEKVRSISGFPCVRGNTIRGFRVARNLGKIDSTGVFFNSQGHRSMTDAQQALISRAKRMGANAITNYFYHRERKKIDGILLGSSWETRYWAEGTAVRLVPD